MSPADKSSKSSGKHHNGRKDHRAGTGDSSASSSRHSSSGIPPAKLYPALSSVEVVRPVPGSIDAFLSVSVQRTCYSAEKGG